MYRSAAGQTSALGQNRKQPIQKVSFCSAPGADLRAPRVRLPSSTRTGLPRRRLAILSGKTIDQTGKVLAKLGDFDGIDRNGVPQGLLFPASLGVQSRWAVALCDQFGPRFATGRLARCFKRSIPSGPIRSRATRSRSSAQISSRWGKGTKTQLVRRPCSSRVPGRETVLGPVLLQVAKFSAASRWPDTSPSKTFATVNASLAFLK